MQYQTTDIARACNVTVNTVRNWCRDYGAFLSAGAAVTDKNRAFTERDKAVFTYIARLRSESMQKAAILQRLGETTFPDEGEDLQPPATVPATVADVLIAHPEPPDAPGGAMLPAAVYLDLERKIDAKFEALQQSQRGAWVYVAWGIVIGIGLSAVFELAAIVANRGH